MIVAEPKLRWLVTCSCGWERECSSEWAARSLSKLVSGIGGSGPPYSRYFKQIAKAVVLPRP